VPVVIDRLTGERRAAQIFVAVLGASSFTYAQATWTQGPLRSSRISRRSSIAEPSGRGWDPSGAAGRPTWHVAVGWDRWRSWAGW
jgi:hypothetical protein